MEKKEKNFDKILKKAIAITSLVAVTFVGSGKLYTNANYKDYSSKNEVNRIAYELNCDTSEMEKTLIFKEYKMLKHNDGEPIYVSFDDNCSQELIQAGENACTYVNTIMSIVNPKYNFVVANDNATIKGTSVKIKSENITDIAKINNNLSATNLITLGQFSTGSTVSINNEKLNSATSLQRENVLKNALCQTLLCEQNAINNFSAPLPNDLEGIASLYSPELVSNTHANVYFNKLNPTLGQAKNDYYLEMLDKVPEHQPMPYENFRVGLRCTYENGNTYIYNIWIENGKYYLGISNYNAHLLEMCCGNIQKVNDVIVLENVDVWHTFEGDKKQVDKTDLILYHTGDNNYSFMEYHKGNIECETCAKPGDKDPWHYFDFVDLLKEQTTGYTDYGKEK